jgi:hypothetical protein
MHIYRDGVRQRTRILYVFRTPGGVRVGRDPLEADMQRQIEAQYPDIAFNWSAVRETQQVIETAVEPRRRRPRREEEATSPEPASAAPAPGPAAAQEPAAPRITIPTAIEGSTPDEQIAFLVHWFPLVRERITKRTLEPARLEALTTLADRLNPSAWTDADQITAGLQSAAEALERLSRVFAKRRRRPRRRPGDARPASPQGSSDSSS